MYEGEVKAEDQAATTDLPGPSWGPRVDELPPNKAANWPEKQQQMQPKGGRGDPGKALPVEGVQGEAWDPQEPLPGHTVLRRREGKQSQHSYHGTHGGHGFG